MLLQQHFPWEALATFKAFMWLDARVAAKQSNRRHIMSYNKVENILKMPKPPSFRWAKLTFSHAYWMPHVDWTISDNVDTNTPSYCDVFSNGYSSSPCHWIVYRIRDIWQRTLWFLYEQTHGIYSCVIARILFHTLHTYTGSICGYAHASLAPMNFRILFGTPDTLRLSPSAPL